MQPDKVNVHDSVGEEPGKATPHGVHDIAARTDRATVGIENDTAQFSVQADPGTHLTGRPGRDLTDPDFQFILLLRRQPAVAAPRLRNAFAGAGSRGRSSRGLRCRPPDNACTRFGRYHRQ